MVEVSAISLNNGNISEIFLCAQLTEAFLRIWDTVIGQQITQAEVPSKETSPFPWIGAVAWIGGSWTGSVRIGMPPEMGRRIASVLLEREDPSAEEINDTLRELTNMTAGNLKSALPGRCGLATPGCFKINSIVEAQDEFLPLMLNWYQCDGLPIFLAMSSLEPSKRGDL